MGRVLLSWIALSALLAAGCAEPVMTSSGEEAVFEDFDVEATDTTGVIRGIVVDQAIVPIEGALIEIKASGLSATTNDAGAFAFADLSPGTYFIEASKAGYKSVQQSAVVEAGVDNPPIVKVRMDADPQSLPYVEVDQFDGFLQCSVRAGFIGYAACSGMADDECCKDLDGEITDFASLNYIQSEATWESTQELGDEMGWSITCMDGPECPDGQIIIGEERKTSPLLVKINETSVRHFFTGQNDIDERMFADGYAATDIEEEEIYAILGQCIEWPILFDACIRYNGIGVILQQPFTAYTHLFYNQLFPPEEWRFTNDGDPPQ